MFQLALPQRQQLFQVRTFFSLSLFIRSIFLCFCYINFVVNTTLFVGEFTQVNITCPPQLPSINIVYAYYGSKKCIACNCIRMDFTHNITLYCANSGNPSRCAFRVENAFFGDTCFFVPKNLWLTYFHS